MIPECLCIQPGSHHSLSCTSVPTLKNYSTKEELGIKLNMHFSQIYKHIYLDGGIRKKVTGL